MSKIAETLPVRRALFVLEYLKDLNASQAALRAGYARSYAGSEGHRLLQDPDVKAAIDEALVERAREVKVEAADVLRMLLEVATADPNDLVETRLQCCRHCHGAGHGYQRTPREMARDRAQHDADYERQRADAKKRNEDPPEFKAFSEAGGIGWDPRKAPHEECPECFGEGVLDVRVKETRLLSGPSRRLYAGIKQTRDGIEVKLRDQDKAVELLGRHLAMFTDKVDAPAHAALAAAILAARGRSS